MTAIRSLHARQILRFKAAFDADFCRQLLGFFVRAAQRHVRHAAKRCSQASSVRFLHTGAVTSIQRFSGSLSLNVHFHTLMLDGAYLEESGSLRFVATPPPTEQDLRRVVREVADKVSKLLGDEDGVDDSSADVAEETCLLFALGAAAIANRTVAESGATRRVDRLDPISNSCATVAALPGHRTSKRHSEHLRYSLHAGVRVPARERGRLEKLCRYMLRPPICLQRMSVIDDGRIAYALRRPWSDGTTMVAFAPTELLQKLATLVPPPRRHQVVYHGVLSSHACSRSRLTPAPRLASPKAARCTPAGAVLASRLSWSELLKRTYGVDTAICPRCGNNLRLIAVITVHEVIRAILQSCGLPAAPPPRRPSTYTCPQRELDWDPA